MSKAGGTATAAGLQFQYLAALECVLARFEESDADFTFITEDEGDDSIDYAITDPENRYLVVTQAKGAVDPTVSSKLSATEVWSVACKLVAHDAARYELRTSRLLSGPASQALHDFTTAQTRTALQQTVSRYRLPTDSPITDEQRQRLSRFTVVATAESLEAMSDYVRELAASIRRTQGLGVGQDSSQVHLAYMVGTLLGWSSRSSNRRFSRGEIAKILRVPSDALARNAGRFDWGLTSGHLPHVATVDRLKIDESISEALHGFPGQRQARCVALTGMSGAGKSTLAAKYAQSAQSKYDSILWVDATDPKLIGPYLRAELNLTASSIPVPEQFRAYLNESCRTWLVVFDNAPNDWDIEPWIEAIAQADFIATSINRVGWSQWHQVAVSEMTEGEAEELVRLRMGISSPSSEEEQRITALVRTLDRWPLALELGCAWLMRTQRGLSVSGTYIEGVTRLIEADESLVPAPYQTHRSLWAAVQFAVNEVSRATEESIAPQDMLRALAFLPPEQGSLKLATTVASNVKQIATVTDQVVDRLVIDLGKASLVMRVPPRSGMPDCVVTNSVVLDVVRNSLPRDLWDAYFVQTLVTLEEHAELLGQSLDGQGPSIVNGINGMSAPLIMASALYAVGLSSDRMAPVGLVLMGNLAMLHMLLGKHNMAIELYERELKWLEATGGDGSLVWAETLMGLAQARLARGDDGHAVSLLLGKAGAAMTSAWLAAQGDATVKLAQGIANCVRMLVWTDRVNADVAAHLLARPREILGEAGMPIMDDPTAIMRLVMDGHEDEAIATIDQMLSSCPGDLETVTLHAARADALTHAGRYGEALAQWELATMECERRSLDLAIISGPIISSWFNVASETWQGTRMAATLVSFFEKKFAALRPPDGGPGIRLQVARLASLASAGDTAVASELLRWLEGVPSVDTAIPPEVLHLLDQCRARIALRLNHGRVPMFALTAWAAGHTPPDRNATSLRFILVGVPSAAGDALRAAALAPTSGRFVSSELGVGIEVGAPPLALLWAWALQDGTGTADLAVERLRVRTCDAHPDERPSMVVIVEAQDTDALATGSCLAVLSEVS